MATKKSSSDITAALVAKNMNCKKANILISSKYRSSLMENKILALGMSKAYKEDGRVVAKLTASELRGILCKQNDGKKISGSFYTRLKSVASEMTGRKIFIEDYEHRSFAVINLIGSATYCKNVLTIKFEPDLTDYLLDLKNNYTVLSIPILMSFEKIYSYRLYELLKSKAFFPKFYDYKTQEFSVCYGISELKLTLGVVDTNAEAVSRALKKPNPDFDKIVNDISKDKNFNMWSDFKKKVIDVAIREINEKSDLTARYKLIREGYGGKVTKIIFLFKKKNETELDNNESYNVIKSVSEDDKISLMDEILEYITEPIKIRDARNLLIAANYDVAEIKRIYDMAKQQKKINNLVGWMLSAIKEQYSVV